GKEASGTGNMKFMMNGAITIGTYDGANIEILDAVGADNFFLFGLKADEVVEQRKRYSPSAIIDADKDFERVMGLIESGHFNMFEPGIFDPVIASIRSEHDAWMTAADFRPYIDAQMAADAAYSDQDKWTRMSIENVAASGRFSSDRTIREYAQQIWGLGDR
ncbi:MAG: glycogen phosphorylase, partial [Pseudomonadales bacterium]|nr:glycogen phosphorylase [Pseudomonadales bacterium]